MILDELTLRRFRNHESLTVQFKPGVTGIVGRNGSGKSSIIESIGFLFTGEADDPKDQVITAGSNGTAYVRGTFTLNDKVGTIERALDTSRVTLEYDGLKLHKAGEVKELWAKLLQVDNHIFQHVIMAKQKKIPELFSGDTAVREKAFQRIFMVPNTEKLRSLIWDGYLKSCPPPLPEDDLTALDRQIAEIQMVLNPKLEQQALMANSVLEERQVSAVMSYEDFYKKCIRDAEQRPLLEAQRKELSSNIELFTGKIAEITQVLQDWPKDLEQQKQERYAAQERHYAYNKKLTKLGNAKVTLINLQVDGLALELEIPALEENRNTFGGQGLALDIELANLVREQATLSSLVSSPTCPTCHQPLQDVAAHLAEIQQKLFNGKEKRAGLTQQFNEATAVLTLKKSRLAQWKTATEQIGLLQEQLQASEVDATYDEGPMEAINMLIVSQKMFETELNTAINGKVKAEASLSIVNERVSHLVTYEGNSSAAEELSLMQEVLQRHHGRIQEINTLNLEIMQLRTEIQMYQQRRTTSAENHEKNMDRTEYMNKLRIAYDVLHTSQFPRKLVQTYASVVEEELHQQLQRFSLPYNARINEEFRIVVTKEGHIIPRLSGGQEMVVGLCLRLALHSMFSQAFPMLIVDEGTTHLDEEAQKLYFQCIEDLKKDKVIQQLIIIDHSAQLIDAVDHVIKL